MSESKTVETGDSPYYPPICSLPTFGYRRFSREDSLKGTTVDQVYVTVFSEVDELATIRRRDTRAADTRHEGRVIVQVCIAVVVQITLRLEHGVQLHLMVMTLVQAPYAGYVA